jgi:hypothetical protein
MTDFAMPTTTMGLRFVLAAGFIVQSAPAQTGASTGGANREEQPSVALSAAPAGYVPMTQAERLRYYLNHMFSAESVLRSATGSAINQELDTPHEWGQGAEGYGRRFGSSYGTHIIQSTAMYGTSAVLHEDNRYFRSGQTGFGVRLKYAIASTFLARHDDGTRHLSFSRIGSDAAAAVISRAWQPPSTIGPVHAAHAFGIFVGVEAAMNVAREFLPAIFHTHDPVVMSRNPAH